MRTIARTFGWMWASAAAVVLASNAFGCAAPVEGDEAELGTSEAAQVAQAPRWKILNTQYQIQETGYWCGPSATRVALSARVSPPSQATLARELGTTTNGTDYIGQVTTVLNNRLGANTYRTTDMPNDPPTQAQRDRLWRDIVVSIDNNYPVVTNIVAPASNHPPGYPNYTIYHYFTVIGYNPDTSEVFVADSANFSGKQQYWLSFNQLATLIPPKGYSSWVPKGTSCAGGEGLVVGEIEKKYLALGGCGSFLGAPTTAELGTPDKVGRFNHFRNGSVYWTSSLGAHEVHGAIRDAWTALGWERSPLGFPTTDENVTPSGVGRYSEFQGGAVYFSPSTGAHEVYGAIYGKWTELGREQSALGYPTTGEYGISGGRQNDFEHGSIRWSSSTYAVTVTLDD